LFKFFGLFLNLKLSEKFNLSPKLNFSLNFNNIFLKQQRLKRFSIFFLLTFKNKIRQKDKFKLSQKILKFRKFKTRFKYLGFLYKVRNFFWHAKRKKKLKNIINSFSFFYFRRKFFNLFRVSCETKLKFNSFFKEKINYIKSSDPSNSDGYSYCCDYIKKKHKQNFIFKKYVSKKKCENKINKLVLNLKKNYFSYNLNYSRAFCFFFKKIILSRVSFFIINISFLKLNLL
jgi:hypothetical protein